MSDPRTHFGYGIYLVPNSLRHIEDELDEDTSLYEAVEKRLLAAFGIPEDASYQARKECPVVFVREHTGEEEEALFLRAKYFHGDWNDNGSPIDPKLFEVPPDAKDTMAKALEALGLDPSLVEKCYYFMLNYIS